MWSSRAQLVYNWWSREQPVTTGIALRGRWGLRVTPGSDTMRCVSCPLCDTPASRRRGFSPVFLFFLSTHPRFLCFVLFFSLLVSQFHVLAICQRFGCLHAAITERMAKGMLEALTTAIRSAIRGGQIVWALSAALRSAQLRSALGGRDRSPCTARSGTARTVHGSKQTLSMSASLAVLCCSVRCGCECVCTVISSPPQVLRKVGNFVGLQERTAS